MRIKHAVALLFAGWLLAGCECEAVCGLHRTRCEDECAEKYDGPFERADYDFCVAGCASQEAQCADSCVDGN